MNYLLTIKLVSKKSSKPDEIKFLNGVNSFISFVKNKKVCNKHKLTK